MLASAKINHPLVALKPVKSSTHVELAREKLRTSGLRITQPRISILETLIRREKPMSIEEIHETLGTGSCDVVTVYRCMAAFEAIGLVRRAFLINGTSLYEINLANKPRYHVFCKDTNQMEDIDPELALELRQLTTKVEESLRAKGYTSVSHIIEFLGISPGASNSPESVPSLDLSQR